MEIAALVLLVLVTLVWLLHKPRSGPTRSHPAPQASPRRPDTQTFDAGSARPPSSDIIVRGAAYVVDGDTIVIGKTQIRLFGIDAPEIDHPHGLKAKWALVSLCAGQKIDARISAQDAYGRKVARCFLGDGRDLSAEMVKLGLAIDWPKFSGGAYRSLEAAGVRKKLWLADARQNGRMHVWEQYETRKKARSDTA